ncbi:MAG: hypothetical protein RJB65_113 [Actinomycetota bacterium]
MTRPVEHLHVRRHNLSLVLRLLATDGPRSRAGIAAVTGLTRATVSSLVADLIERGLVDEAGPEEDQRVGRPATLVRLDGASVATIGVELDVGFVSVLVSDLSGRIVHQRRKPITKTSTAFPDLFPVIARETRQAVDAAEAAGMRVAGLTVAIPGIVDVAAGIVRRAPNLGWTDAPLGPRLTAEFGSEIPVWFDNEANLAAIAEYRMGASAGSAHLVYLLAVNGVGAGVVVDGELFRGVSGSAGEVGHMTVQPKGSPCACGSKGCWETTIGLRALLVDAVPDLAPGLMRDRRLSPEAKVAPVIARARAQHPLALKGLQKYGHWLGIGLANVVDAFNPEVIVLGGFLPQIAEWVMPEARRTMEAHSLTDAFRRCTVELTTLGFTAGALGGTILAAERVFLDPTVVPTR